MIARSSAVGSTAMQRIGSMRYKLAAVVIWGGAVITTQLLLSDLLIGFRTLDIWIAAVTMQLVLTVLQSPVWSGQRTQVGVAAVALDTLINAAGIWPFIQRIDQTNVWIMIADATPLSGSISDPAALVAALAVGYFLAAAPESIWR